MQGLQHFRVYQANAKWFTVSRECCMLVHISFCKQELAGDIGGDQNGLPPAIQVDPSMNVFKSRGGKDRLRLVCFFGILLRIIVRLLRKKNVKKTRFTQLPQRHKLGKVPRSCFFFTRNFFVRFGYR